FVRAALVFVLDIENGIDEVFAFQWAYAVLPTESSEDCAVAESGLPIEIQLGCPPSSSAVFEFGPERVEVVAGALRAEGGKIFDFQIAGLFKVVIIGNDIGALLSASGQRKATSKRQEQKKKPGTKMKEGQAVLSLQVICKNNFRLT